MRRSLQVFLIVCTLLLLFTHLAAAQALSPADQVRRLIHPAEEGIEAAEQNKPELMRVEYEEIHTLWESFEDQVREADPQAYVELETALDQLKDAVMAQPLDPAKVKTAYAHLKDEAGEIATRLGGATGLSAQIRDLATHAKAGIAAAEQNKPELMRAEYEELHTLWASFEDQVREKDASGYVELETALDQIKDAVNTQPIDTAKVKAAYEQLEHEADEVAGRLGTAVTPTGSIEVALPDALKLLDAAAAATAQGDSKTSATQLDAFIRAWPAIEGAVATKSGDAYEAIEAEMGRARAALKAQPADLAAAQSAITRMRAELAPFSAAQTYTWFDAAAIILREGLEALLVIVALLAFLRKSGNADKRGWIWAGAALGVLVSIATAFLLQAIFSRVSAGANRELIEGATGLVAAALLFYVSYWLHSKASLGAWKQYIDQRTTQALARGSMAGLALLAFLAVFREGAETAVFYLGIAPAIALRDLLLGLGLGVVVLSVAAVLMLVVGIKLPLRPFFRIAGLLVYYLGFKFVGTGLHALQVAGVIPTAPIPSLGSNPIFDFFGIYPTWQTLLPQVLLLLGALLAWLYLHAQEQKVRATEVVVTA
jgi:high-affinity iron transporter